MAKRSPTPPEPQQQYEGYRWLGSQWGRSGASGPPQLGAVAMGLAAFIVFGVAIRATTWDRPLFVLLSVVIGLLCALGCAFYVIESTFAARAAREQQPFTPRAD